MVEELLDIYKYEGRGEILLLHNKIVPIIFIISHRKYGATKFKTEIRLDGNNDLSLLHYISESCEKESISIKSLSPLDYDISIEFITGISICSETLTLTHYKYDLGVTKDYDVRNKNLHLEIGLTKCDFLRSCSQILSYEGTISMPCGKNQTVTWDTQYGKAEIALNYTYESDLKVDNHKSVLQIENPRITICMPPDKHNPSEIFDKIEEEIKDPLKLVSFFSRHLVNYSYLKLIVFVNRGLNYPSPQRNYINSEEYFEGRVMFEHTYFKNNMFNKTLINYRNSDCYHAVNNSLSFLISSYHGKSIETGYFLVHSALESLCKFITKEIPRNKMKDYQRVIETLHRLEINPFYIWKNIGYEEGIKNVFSLRNELFHEARSNDYSQLYKNKIKFQELLELIILKILGLNPHDRKFYLYW